MTSRFPHVVATVRVYNEADIVDQVLGHLSEQGINFVVLDGGSLTPCDSHDTKAFMASMRRLLRCWLMNTRRSLS